MEILGKSMVGPHHQSRFLHGSDRLDPLEVGAWNIWQYTVERNPAPVENRCEPVCTMWLHVQRSTWDLAQLLQDSSWCPTTWSNGDGYLKDLRMHIKQPLCPMAQVVPGVHKLECSMLNPRVVSFKISSSWFAPSILQVEGLNLTVDPSTFHVPDVFGKPRRVEKRMKWLFSLVLNCFVGKGYRGYTMGIPTTSGLKRLEQGFCRQLHETNEYLPTLAKVWFMPPSLPWFMDIYGRNMSYPTKVDPPLEAST